MSRKTVFRSVGVLCILICAAGAIFLFEQPWYYTRMVRLQSQVDEQLANGASEDEVAGWCLSHGFGVPVKRAGGAPSHMSWSTSFAIDSSPVRGIRLAIDFYFDAGSRLTRRVVRRYSSGVEVPEK
jgi:hypothetical protein